MKTATPSKLAQYAAPMRGRPKYAPLTAGLLARKGEAVPATAHFAAEAFELFGPSPHVPPANYSAGYAPPPLPVQHHTPGPIGARPHPGHALHARPARPPEPAAPWSAPEPRPQTEELHQGGPLPAEHRRAISDPAPPYAVDAETSQTYDGIAVPPRAQMTLEIDLDTLVALSLAARRRQASPSAVLSAALEAFLKSA